MVFLNKGDNQCKKCTLRFCCGFLDCLEEIILYGVMQREYDNVVFLSTEVLDFYRTKWQQFKHCPKKETSDSCLIDPFCVTIWSSSLIKHLKKSKTRSPY